MTNEATDRTRQHIIDGAGSTRRDEMDASAGTVLNSYAVFLAEVQDEVRHQVGVARSLGLSWAEVGAALGVSKQAAQQRYGA